MQKTKCFSVLFAAFGLLCTSLLVGVSFYRLGIPLTLYTWGVVALCAASGASLAFSGKRRLFFVMSMAVGVYLAAPGPFQVIPGIEKWSLVDDVGGRSGWEISPGLRFGSDGPNTAILESYVGPLKPNWWRQSLHSPYIRDGDERVQSRNVIQFKYFQEVLRLLPSDEARRSVIKSLTNTQNRLRVHQGLLLACLFNLKYPAGMDAKLWWGQHRNLFVVQRDPILAASVTQGWFENVGRIYSRQGVPATIASQFRAVRYQEQGGWGGHSDFGEAFMRIEAGENKIDARYGELGSSVVWWPERQPQGNR